jgi:hypothetical protein
MATTAKITPALVDGWLKEMGCTPTKASPLGPDMVFQFLVDYPTGTPNRLHAFSPSARPRALIVLSEVSLSPEHLTTFQELEQQDKIEFLQDLQRALNREYVEYALSGVSPNTLSCPTGFQVTGTRYDDGISLDSFARTLSSVFKAEMAGVACVQKHLNPHTFGGGGQFDFKRTGGLQ